MAKVLSGEEGHFLMTKGLMPSSRKGKSVTANLSAEGTSVRSRGRAFNGKDSGAKPAAALPGLRREAAERDGLAVPPGRGRLQEPIRTWHWAEGRTG